MMRELSDAISISRENLEQESMVLKNKKLELEIKVLEHSLKILMLQQEK